MDVLPLAHGTGHWVIDIGIYLGPFLAIVSVVMVTDRRRQRREAAEEAAEAPAKGTPAEQA
jgi:hypothetical protein